MFYHWVQFPQNNSRPMNKKLGPTMKIQRKKERNRTVTHKSTPDIHKIERERRRKRREEIKKK